MVKQQGMLKPWTRIRTVVLIVLFGAVVLVLGKIMLLANAEVLETADITMPDSIPLEGWQDISAKNLNDQDPEKPGYLKGREYDYMQNSTTLNVQARYISGTNGDVERFINHYLPSSLEIDSFGAKNWEVHTFEGVGSFLLLVEQKNIQLSSCINPYGGSTVSARAYKRNRNFQDIRYRLVPWLLGESLKDERCLWTHMSISQEGGKSVAMNSSIEAVWANWYQWWSVQLPEMRS